MTHDDALFGYRLQVFERASRTSVSEACRTFGIHRSTYYRWKRQVDRHGLEMLRPRERRRPAMPNALPKMVEERIVGFRSPILASARAGWPPSSRARSGAGSGSRRTAPGAALPATASRPASGASPSWPATGRPTSRPESPSPSATYPAAGCAGSLRDRRAHGVVHVAEPGEARHARRRLRRDCSPRSGEGIEPSKRRAAPPYRF